MRYGNSGLLGREFPVGRHLKLADRASMEGKSAHKFQSLITICLCWQVSLEYGSVLIDSDTVIRIASRFSFNEV